jgi:hypothetical protein
MDETANRHGVILKKGLLVEEFLRGREFSIDSFVSPTGQMYHSPIVDVVAAEDIGIEDYHVFARMLPTQFNSSQVTAIEEVAEKGIRALQMVNVAAHIDMVYTPTGPQLFEVGARVGGYRSEMMKLSLFEKSTAVLEFFPHREGVLKGIKGLEGVRRLGSFYRLRERMKSGERIGLARQGYRCPLFVVLNHEDTSMVNRDVEEAREIITIEVG